MTFVANFVIFTFRRPAGADAAGIEHWAASGQKYSLVLLIVDEGAPSGQSIAWRDRGRCFRPVAGLFTLDLNALNIPEVVRVHQVDRIREDSPTCWVLVRLG